MDQETNQRIAGLSLLQADRFLEHLQRALAATAGVSGYGGHRELSPVGRVSGLVLYAKEPIGEPMLSLQVKIADNNEVYSAG